MMSISSAIGLLLAASVVSVDVAPDKPSAVYACGEQTALTVTIRDKATGTALTEGVAHVRLDDTGPTAILERDFDLAAANPFTVTGTIDHPGVLRMRIAPKSGDWTVDPRSGQWDWAWGSAFDPDAMRPVLDCPADFERFWKDARAELDRTVPVDLRTEEVTSMETGRLRFRRFSVASHGRRVYGLMSIPKAATGKLPVWVYVPGAGCADWSNIVPEFGQDAINVLLTVFPWEVDWATDGGTKTMAAYKALLADVKEKENVDGYGLAGLASGAREDYFFYPVILGGVRALECIAAMDEVDPRRIYYFGSSQGGGVGLMLTALFGKFAGSACMVPAFCDLDAESAGRLAGWPIAGSGAAFRTKVRDTLRYFDVCNFVRMIRTPVVIGVGGGDTVNPPTGGISAFAVCPAQEKRLVFVPNQGHDTAGSVCQDARDWIGQRTLAVRAETECESAKAIVFVNPDTTSFWRTAAGNKVELPVRYPEGATSATLSVVADGYEKVYENVAEGEFELGLPAATDAASENVYDLTLAFDDGTVRTARIGVIRGVQSGAEGVTRCNLPLGTSRGQGVRGRTVIPVPYGTETLCVDGEDVETGLDGAQGWYALCPLDAGARRTLSAVGQAFGESFDYEAVQFGLGGMSILVR